MQRRAMTIVVALSLLVATAAVLLTRRKPTAAEASPEAKTADAVAAETPTDPPPPTLRPGDRILEEYASPATTATQDLERVYYVIDTFQVLLKTDGALPLGSNGEIVQALTGKNPHRLEFISADHPAIDAQGRLVDRWDTPLFFHAVSRNRIEIRSAGPDRTMWTEDDIHRNPNGSFRKAEEMVPESLFETRTD